MNSSDESPYVLGEDQLIFMKIFTINTAITGTIGNLLTILAIVKGKFYHHACYLFILNLNVTNLIHCVVFHPLLAAQVFNGIWTNNMAGCIAVSYGLFVNMGTELWGYVCITLNRYFCVVHHSLYPRIYKNNKILWSQLAFTWLFYPAVFLLPLTGLWGHFEYAPQKLMCHPFAGYHCDGFCLFIFVLAILTTLPVIVYCYASIIVTYVKSQKKVGLSRDVSRNKSASTDVIFKAKDDNYGAKKARSESRMAFTILAVIAVFGICRLPFMLLYLYDPSVSKVKPVVHTALIYIGSNSNWINPIIYSFTNAQIRKTLAQLFLSLRPCKS